jgi:hypothetical protein
MLVDANNFFSERIKIRFKVCHDFRVFKMRCKINAFRQIKGEIYQVLSP